MDGGESFEVQIWRQKSLMIIRKLFLINLKLFLIFNKKVFNAQNFLK